MLGLRSGFEYLAMEVPSKGGFDAAFGAVRWLIRKTWGYCPPRSRRGQLFFSHSRNA